MDRRRGIGKVCSQMTSCRQPAWVWRTVGLGVDELWCESCGRFLGRREDAKVQRLAREAAEG